MFEGSVCIEEKSYIRLWGHWSNICDLGNIPCIFKKSRKLFFKFPNIIKIVNMFKRKPTISVWPCARGLSVLNQRVLYAFEVTNRTFVSWISFPAMRTRNKPMKHWLNNQFDVHSIKLTFWISSFMAHTVSKLMLSGQLWWLSVIYLKTCYILEIPNFG